MSDFGWMPWLAGTMCLLPLLWFVVGIILCIWVYRDAQSRGMNGVMWLIVVLIAGLIGFIIYMVVRKDRTATGELPPSRTLIRVCPSCGREVATDTEFCPHCGKPVPK